VHIKQQKQHCAGLHMPGGQHSISSMSHTGSSSHDSMHVAVIGFVTRIKGVIVSAMK
jgi:hypothetical protein